SARQLRTRTQQSSNQSQRSSYFPGSAVHQIQNLLSCLISFLRQDQGLMFYLISFLRQDQGLMFYLFATGLLLSQMILKRCHAMLTRFKGLAILTQAIFRISLLFVSSGERFPVLPE